jgi:hypothetical protein
MLLCLLVTLYIPEDGHNSWSKHVAGYAVYNTINSHIYICTCCRSQWPRGLRRGSAVGRLLGLRVIIVPGAWMFTCWSVVCYQVEVTATS